MKTDTAKYVLVVDGKRVRTKFGNRIAASGAYDRARKRGANVTLWSVHPRHGNVVLRTNEASPESTFVPPRAKANEPNGKEFGNCAADRNPRGNPDIE